MAVLILPSPGEVGLVRSFFISRFLSKNSCMHMEHELTEREKLYLGQKVILLCQACLAF